MAKLTEIGLVGGTTTAKDGDQTFATVIFVFPCDHATSLQFSFDAAGRVSGIAVGGMGGIE